MAMGPDILIPTDGHLPPTLGSIPVLRADQEVCDFDCGIEASSLEKLAYTGHDFADKGVALSRSFISWGCRSPENRDYGGVWVEIEIDGKRIKEGSGRGWHVGVVFVVVKRHFTELIGEVDSRDSLGVGA
jgi:hypothetical protein